MRTDIHRLSEKFQHAADVSKGSRLTPADVDIALAALRAAVEDAHAERGSRSVSFQIEALGEDGWPLEVLAVVHQETLARAVFARVVGGESTRKLRLRVGERVLVDVSAV
jgi:hypothetical protein